jgi:hypothetical protein
VSDKPDLETPADRALFRLLVAGLVLALGILAACAVWPWVMGGAR